MVQKERIIKKYASRRLYDTFDSEYIAFKELQNLITNGIPLKIIDAKTKEDVTHSVIVSLVLENTDLLSQFSDEFLKSVISLYGKGQQQRELFGVYFQQSLMALINTQSKFTDSANVDALAYLTELGKQHQKLNENFMNELLNFGKQT